MVIYEIEALNNDSDDGTMPSNVAELQENIVGKSIVNIERTKETGYGRSNVTILTLNDGTKVQLADTDDCCAYTTLDTITVNLPNIEHVITGVGTTEEYTTWHIYGNAGDIVNLGVDWSCGNTFYYGYGFEIKVVSMDGEN